MNSNESGLPANPIPPALVQRKRASELAGMIETEIMQAGWPVGKVIGTFAQLIERYGVSRGVVREAVGLLEHKMLVRVRVGPSGGIEVRAPVQESVVHAMGAYFDFSGVSDGELAELRHVLFGLATRLAADRIDEAGVAKLRAVIDRETKAETSRPALLSNHLAFFSMLTELSRNPVLSLFWAALSQRVTDGIGRGFNPTESRREKQHAIHRKLADLVIAGNGGQAEAMSREYLDRRYQAASLEVADQSRAGLSDRETIADVMTQFGMSVAPTERRHEGKVPARLARTLLQEVRNESYPVGHVLGMERELIARHDVSRNAFREAVRILEYYGFAEMRRGPKGGLTVRGSNSARMEETIMSYLAYMDIEYCHLLDVRVAVEGTNVEWAIQRAGGRLEELEKFAYPRRAGSQPKTRFSLHQKLAELSGNRATALLTNVLTQLLDNRKEPRTLAYIADRTPSEIEAIFGRARDDHNKIVEATTSGDVGLARHRIRRHLEYFATEVGIIYKMERRAK
ncbi:FCD domain-containing protein [Myxococcota bacterium]|nr:FCD domain-containing protein [Myxococcota bacterium]